MPKIKVTPKRGEKGFRGPGSKPKPKAKKGPGPSSKGRSTTGTRQETITEYTASGAARGRKRAASARVQTDSPAKRPRRKEVRQVDTPPEGGSEEGRSSSRPAKGRAVSGRGKGKGKEMVRGQEARSTKAVVGGSRRATRSFASEEESDEEGGTRPTERAARVPRRGNSDDSGGVRGRGAVGSRRRGRRRVHVSSDEGEDNSPGQERSRDNFGSGEDQERQLTTRTRRKQVTKEKEYPRDSQESRASDEEGGSRRSGGERMPQTVGETAADGGPKKASVREVTVADSSVAKWEAISGEASRVMGDAMLSALGRCVEGLNGGRKQRTEQELQRLMNRVEDRLRESKGPKTGRMKAYATAKQSSRALKDKCLELLQRNQVMEDRMEERLGSVEAGKQRTEQLKETISEQSERSPPAGAELLEVPLQLSDEEDDSEEFLEELVGFLQRSRQAELQSGD